MKRFCDNPKCHRHKLPYTGHIVEAVETEPTSLRSIGTSRTDSAQMITGERREVSSLKFEFGSKTTTLCGDCADVAEYVASFINMERLTKPMHSAPKDGRKVLLYKGSAIYCGSYAYSSEYAAAALKSGYRGMRETQFLENLGEQGNWYVFTPGKRKKKILKEPEGWRHI